MKYLTLFVLALLSLPAISGSCASSSSIDDSIVQVWEPAGTVGGEASLISFGVAVGDGSQVLTVLNYEYFTPGSLEVGLPGQVKYAASIEAIDPRTSATLLRVEGTMLRAATIGEPDALKPESEVIVYGWTAPDYSTIKSERVPFPGYGNGFFMEVGEGYIASDGSMVTDEQGRVIGLIGTFYNAFVFRPGGPGMTAPIINIQSALGLLSPDAVNQPWADGPAFSLITTKDSVTGHTSAEPPLTKYSEMTAAIQSLLATMSEPLPANELPGYYRGFSWGGPESVDGTLLSVVYPRPVELRNTGGQVVAEAKWVGIQWGRSEGKPNRLFYGHIESGNAIAEGGFTLNGDITELENTLHY
jgi:hypothetical protein